MLWLYLTALSLIIGGEIIALLHRNIHAQNSKSTIERFSS